VFHYKSLLEARRRYFRKGKISVSSQTSNASLGQLKNRNDEVGHAARAELKRRKGAEPMKVTHAAATLKQHIKYGKVQPPTLLKIAHPMRKASGKMVKRTIQSAATELQAERKKKSHEERIRKEVLSQERKRAKAVQLKREAGIEMKFRDAMKLKDKLRNQRTAAQATISGPRVIVQPVNPVKLRIATPKEITAPPPGGFIRNYVRAKLDNRKGVVADFARQAMDHNANVAAYNEYVARAKKAQDDLAMRVAARKRERELKRLENQPDTINIGNVRGNLTNKVTRQVIGKAYDQSKLPDDFDPHHEFISKGGKIRNRNSAIYGPEDYPTDMDVRPVSPRRVTQAAATLTAAQVAKQKFDTFHSPMNKQRTFEYREREQKYIKPSFKTRRDLMHKFGLSGLRSKVALKQAGVYGKIPAHEILRWEMKWKGKGIQPGTDLHPGVNRFWNQSL
jgi:hypothetical protein